MHSDLTVGSLIDKDLGSKVRKIVDMDMKAKKEDGLQKTMDSLQKTWDKDHKIKINADNEIEKADDLFEETTVWPGLRTCSRVSTRPSLLQRQRSGVRTLCNCRSFY